MQPFLCKTLNIIFTKKKGYLLANNVQPETTHEKMRMSSVTSWYNMTTQHAY